MSTWGFVVWPVCPWGFWGQMNTLGDLTFALPLPSEISEITSIKKEDVISTLQYLNLINYYKVRRRA